MQSQGYEGNERVPAPCLALRVWRVASPAIVYCPTLVGAGDVRVTYLWESPEGSPRRGEGAGSGRREGDMGPGGRTPDTRHSGNAPSGEFTPGSNPVTLSAINQPSTPRGTWFARRPLIRTFSAASLSDSPQAPFCRAQTCGSLSLREGTVILCADEASPGRSLPEE
jgi:hypothetical protein